MTTRREFLRGLAAFCLDNGLRMVPPLPAAVLAVKDDEQVPAGILLAFVDSTSGSPDELAVVRHYIATGVPGKFLFADGSAVSRTQYAALFAVLGTTFGGSGDHFNLPDLRERAGV